MASVRAKARATSPVSARIVVKTTPMEAGAAPGADTDTHDLGIANPPTPAPTEANAEGSTIPRAELIGAMKCVSHMNFNGNPSVFEDAEVDLARDATTLFLPESDSRFLIVFTHIVSRVAKMIGWYGDDGYGDKPEDMPRFTYWFQTFRHCRKSVTLLSTCRKGRLSYLSFALTNQHHRHRSATLAKRSWFAVTLRCKRGSTSTVD